MKGASYLSWFWFRGGKEHLQQTMGETTRMTAISELVEKDSVSPAQKETKAFCSGREPHRH